VKQASVDWLGWCSLFQDKHLHVWEMDENGVYRDTSRDDDASSAPTSPAESDEDEAPEAVPASSSGGGAAAVPTPRRQRGGRGVAVPPGAPKKGGPASEPEPETPSPEVVKRAKELKTVEEKHVLYPAFVELMKRLGVSRSVVIWLWACVFVWRVVGI
jgi:hypothetical protein